MALIPRTARGHGWLRPAIGVVELSQNIIQVCFYAPCLESILLSGNLGLSLCMTLLNTFGANIMFSYLYPCSHLQHIKEKNVNYKVCLHSINIRWFAAYS